MRQDLFGWRTSVLASIVVLLVFASSACTSSTWRDAEAQTESMTFVFVHGAWGGGWQFSKIEPLLETEGHRVYRPTMTGLGERVHLASPDVSLSTHIEDIVKVFEFEDFEEVILVGHSYGGMVITGVAERVPEKIARLVYLDAILPEDGESVESLFGDSIQSMASVGEGEAGSWLLYPRWVEPGKLPPVDVPQPIRTFTEPIDLSNPHAEGLPAVYILTVEEGKDADTFDVFADRARERGWKVTVMVGGHNPYWFQPEATVDVLFSVVEDQEAKKGRD